MSERHPIVWAREKRVESTWTQAKERSSEHDHIRDKIECLKPLLVDYRSLYYPWYGDYHPWTGHPVRKLNEKNMEIWWAHLWSKFDFLPGDVLSWSVKECNDTWPDAAVGSDRNGTELDWTNLNQLPKKTIIWESLTSLTFDPYRVRTDWMVWMARAAASVTEQILMDSGVKLLTFWSSSGRCLHSYTNQEQSTANLYDASNLQTCPFSWPWFWMLNPLLYPSHLANRLCSWWTKWDQ